jgi:hypothetical protein
MRSYTMALSRARRRPGPRRRRLRCLLWVAFLLVFSAGARAADAVLPATLDNGAGHLDLVNELEADRMQIP